jgi:hypothetical protein
LEETTMTAYYTDGSACIGCGATDVMLNVDNRCFRCHDYPAWPEFTYDGRPRRETDEDGHVTILAEDGNGYWPDPFCACAVCVHPVNPACICDRCGQATPSIPAADDLPF